MRYRSISNSLQKNRSVVCFLHFHEDIMRHPQKPVFNVDESMSVEDAKCLDRGYLLLRPCKRVEDPRSLVLVPSNEKVPR